MQLLHYPEEPMATLKITVHGLCLFVPYNGAMYVVMPKTGPTVNNGRVPPHGASLMMDHKYYSSGDARTHIDLDGHQLEIYGVATSDVSSKFPCGVVNITDFSNLKVPKENLEQNSLGTVNARVVLTGGSMLQPMYVACWYLPNGEIAGMTHEVVWSIPIVSSSGEVDLLLNDLDSGTGSGTPLVTLKPDPDTDPDTIAIEIHHHKIGIDTPFLGQRMERPPHFAGYYLLLEDVFFALPGYDPTGSCECQNATVVTLDDPLFPRTSTIYTCMAAGAEPGS
jgi:hypothetical protein